MNLFLIVQAFLFIGLSSLMVLIESKEKPILIGYVFGVAILMIGDWLIYIYTIPDIIVKGWMIGLTFIATISEIVCSFIVLLMYKNAVWHKDT